MPISPKSYPVLKNKVSALSVSKRTRFCRRMCERLFDLSWYVRKPKLFLDSIDSSVIALRYLRKMNYERKIIINLILLKRKKNILNSLERITNRKRYLLFIYLYMWRAPKHVLFKKGWRHTFKFLSLRKFSNQKWPFFVKEKSNKIFLLSKLFYFTFFRDVTSFIAELCAGTTTYGQNLKKKKKVFFFF